MQQRIDEILSGPRPLPLSGLSLPAPLRIAVLAPHPDDFDAIGVTMRMLHTAGHHIDVAVLTSGTSGVEDGYNGVTTDTEKAAMREAEQRASCTFFGLTAERLSFLRLWQRDDDAADDERLRDYLRARVPQLAFMPHGNDSNRTHRRVYETFKTIVQAERLPVWAFLNRDAKTIGMRTDAYTGFDEEAARWKAELLRFHGSQQTRNLNARKQGFDERVLCLNRGCAAGAGAPFPYAEAFELQRLP